MTTIATDGHEMAADGLSVDSNGEVVVSSRPKLQRLPDGSLVGGSGSTVDIRRAAHALHDPSATADDFTGDFHLLRLMPTGKVLRYEGSLFPFQVDKPAAVGSGGSLALGAMLAGASPREAVEIAKKRDVSTGGRITSYGRSL